MKQQSDTCLECPMCKRTRHHDELAGGASGRESVALEIQKEKPNWISLRRTLATALLLELIMLPGCSNSPPSPAGPQLVKSNSTQTESTQSPELYKDDDFAQNRRSMVDHQLRGRGIQNLEVLASMLRVQRHLFVPEHLQRSAYTDGPLPIGHGQTISQPYVVAIMTELVRPQSSDRVLEVGTGCGYQAAVLAELVKDVYSIEIVEELANDARQRLERLGYHNIHVRHGDGYQGWEEHAPFHIIVVTAAPDHIPQPLLDQLAPGGRMVLPVGRFRQSLKLLEKDADGSLRETDVAPVAFVPMTGEAQRR